jgi:CRP-like cAMP-binding protein
LNALKGMQKVNVLKYPDSFGEASLISKKSQGRAASIICEEDCWFGVLDKTSFEKILFFFEERKYKNNL